MKYDFIKKTELKLTEKEYKTIKRFAEFLFAHSSDIYNGDCCDYDIMDCFRAYSDERIKENLKECFVELTIEEDE